MKRTVIYLIFAGMLILATPCFAASADLEIDHQFDALYIARADEQDTGASSGNIENVSITPQQSQEPPADGMAAYIAEQSGLGLDYGIQLSQLIYETAEEYGVDPVLAASLFDQESRFRMDAVSPVGAVGIAQLMPETAASMGYDPYRLEENVRGGIEYLNYQLHRFSHVFCQADFPIFVVGIPHRHRGKIPTFSGPCQEACSTTASCRMRACSIR